VPAGYYAASKLIAEGVFKTVCFSAYTIFRISGIYGFEGPRHLGLNASIDNALLYGKSPSLRGEGAALRNYISVDDAATWITSEACAPTSIRKIIYMAGKETMPIRQWLQTIVDILLPDGKIEEAAGEDSIDIIVEASPSPVALQSFAEYLRKVKEERNDVR
jgi:nucleoside-diphosphate-sugar epimerase